MYHAGQHTACPVDITILQKPGDQDSRNVAEEFGRKIMRPTESNNRAVGAKEPLTCGLQTLPDPHSNNSPYVQRRRSGDQPGVPRSHPRLASGWQPP